MVVCDECKLVSMETMDKWHIKVKKNYIFLRATNFFHTDETGLFY